MVDPFDKDEITRDNLLVNTAFSMAMASMASKYIPELRVRNVIYLARPLTLSYECEGRLCEEFMHEVHSFLEESGYNITIEVKGSRYTFHIHKKLKL